MTTRKNPFSASFGVSPPLLVGRDDIIDDFGTGLDEGPGAPERVTLFQGARGVGKTVLLNAVEDQAKERGWLTLSTTAQKGFVERLQQDALPELLSEHHPSPVSRRMTGGGIASLASFTHENIDQYPRDRAVESMLRDLCSILDERGTGLLITVDEVHHKVTEELALFGSIVQHLRREELPIAVAMAGLPDAVEDLLSDRHAATFIRRADKHILTFVDDEDVARALREPVEGLGRQWAPEALEYAVSTADGYPFLIQLVGTHVWRKAGSSELLDLDAAKRGCELAQRKIGSLVHEPALNDLSAVDRSVLAAMALDDGPSSTAVLAERLNVEANYLGVYRARLIRAGMIVQVGFGLVDYALPHLREYLREHAAAMPFLPKGR